MSNGRPQGAGPETAPASTKGPPLAARAPRRVFIGLTDVAGYFGALADGFREAGIGVMFVDESPDPFRYRSPSINVRIGRALTTSSERARRGPKRAGWRAVTLGLRIVRAGLRVVTLVVALARCDAFIFTAGSGFFRGRELPLLRRLGKRIIWVFTGSDHRPPYLNGRAVRAARFDGWESLAAATRRLHSNVRLIERHADVIVAHTASAQFHTRPFVRFLSMGIPSGPPAGSRSRPAPLGGSPSSPVRILHSPTDSASKGTSVIRAIVERLGDVGRPVAYVELTLASHDEVIAALAEADLVLNEVWGDTPMGVLAAEAATFGVPNVLGSYYAAEIDADVGLEPLPPSAFVLPDALEATVRRLVVGDEARTTLGQEAARFVKERWAAVEVARRYLRLITGDIPESWLADPATIGYVGGWGMSMEERLAAIRAYVGAMGPEALCLPRGSRLRERIEREVLAA